MSHGGHEHRRRRSRRRRRRVYIRSVYFLPSLATLGNAVCGFGAIYVASLQPGGYTRDPWTAALSAHHFTVAAYLIFLALVFDALDGRLARFTRHTTDFGGQLDSLADVISFGAAPAFLALQVLKFNFPEMAPVLSRLTWAIGALFMSCAALRLARFNVSNEHGEQHHFSFLGLPSPGAGGVVAAFVLMQQHLAARDWDASVEPAMQFLATLCLWLLPLVVAGAGLLMVSNVRYPHLVNRYLRGKRSIASLLAALALLLLLVVAHQITIGVGTLIYALWGPVGYLWHRYRPSLPPAPAGP